LNIEGTSSSFKGAGKFNQKRVAYRFDFSTVMFREEGSDESSVFFEELHCESFVSLR
jgi:hypothetical protein